MPSIVNSPFLFVDHGETERVGRRGRAAVRLCTARRFHGMLEAIEDFVDIRFRNDQRRQEPEHRAVAPAGFDDGPFRRQFRLMALPVPWGGPARRWVPGTTTSAPIIRPRPQSGRGTESVRQAPRGPPQRLPTRSACADRFSRSTMRIVDKPATIAIWLPRKVPACAPGGWSAAARRRPPPITDSRRRMPSTARARPAGCRNVRQRTARRFDRVRSALHRRSTGFHAAASAHATRSARSERGCNPFALHDFDDDRRRFGDPASGIGQDGPDVADAELIGRRAVGAERAAKGIGIGGK